MQRFIKLIRNDQVEYADIVKPLVDCYQVVEGVVRPALESVLVASVVPCILLRFNQIEIGPACCTLVLSTFYLRFLQVFQLCEHFSEYMVEENLSLVAQLDLNCVIVQAKSGVNIAIFFIQNTACLRYLL